MQAVLDQINNMVNSTPFSNTGGVLWVSHTYRLTDKRRKNLVSIIAFQKKKIPICMSFPEIGRNDWIHIPAGIL